MRRFVCLVISLVLLFGGVSVAAMDFEFDDLFGDDLLTDLESVGDTVRPEEALLTQEGWELGGHYNLSLNASRTQMEGFDPEDMFRIALGSDFYFDARPDPNFRVFAKMKLAANTAKDNDVSLQLKLGELFSDFNYENKLFFRAGKQNARWGVGYFFSPADVISVGRIDPQDPDKQLEGPIALKIHYPFKSNNYYTYLLFDGAKAFSEIAIAPKAEFVFGRSEIGLGAYYQKGKAPRAMATVSSSLGNIGLFAEVVVSRGSDKGFVGELGLADYPIRQKEQLFLHATAGAHYAFNDPEGHFNVTGAVQYYFNGEGYRDQAMIADFRGAYSVLLISKPDLVKHVAKNDLSSTGRHYLAVLGNWNKIFNSKFSLSGAWTANLSDRSGVVSSTLSLPSFSRISPSVGVSFNYGDAFTEFGLAGKRVTTVFAAVTLGSGSF